MLGSPFLARGGIAQPKVYGILVAHGRPAKPKLAIGIEVLAANFELIFCLNISLGINARYSSVSHKTSVNVMFNYKYINF